MQNRLSISLVAVILVTLCLSNCNDPTDQKTGPYFATGIKIGEVTENSAIIWSRLTERPVRVGSDAPMPTVYYEKESGERATRERLGGRPDLPVIVEYPEGYDVTTIEGAAPGVSGYLKINYRKEGADSWEMTAWVQVDQSTDFSSNIEINGLEANTTYELEVLSSWDGVDASESIKGKFSTAPPSKEQLPIVFTATTCTSYGDVDSTDYGNKIYDQMEVLQPAFFVHLGDILYYDGMGKTDALARWHWDRMYSLPAHIDFHQKTASYFIKDDHDTWMNDSWPGRETRFMGEFTFEEGLRFFREEVPIDSPTYRTFRWGKDLQIWMVEGRDYRSPNTMPDGPEKTIWGDVQKKWFYETVENSDATFKLLFSPTPIVGPDRENKKDNHSNEGFSYEGKEIREFLSKQDNMFVICGDRHWQYVSVDSTTHVMEFSCGAGNDDHAGGWDQGDVRPEHKYLNVVGGFLSGKLSYEEDIPRLAIRHHAVDGTVLHEENMEPAGK